LKKIYNKKLGALDQHDEWGTSSELGLRGGGEHTELFKKTKRLGFGDQGRGKKFGGDTPF